MSACLESDRIFIEFSFMTEDFSFMGMKDINQSLGKDGGQGTKLNFKSILNLCFCLFFNFIHTHTHTQAVFLYFIHEIYIIYFYIFIFYIYLYLYFFIPQYTQGLVLSFLPCYCKSQFRERYSQCSLPGLFGDFSTQEVLLDGFEMHQSPLWLIADHNSVIQLSREARPQRRDRKYFKNTFKDTEVP